MSRVEVTFNTVTDLKPIKVVTKSGNELECVVCDQGYVELDERGINGIVTKAVLESEARYVDHSRYESACNYDVHMLKPGEYPAVYTAHQFSVAEDGKPIYVNERVGFTFDSTLVSEHITSRLLGESKYQETKPNKTARVGKGTYSFLVERGKQWNTETEGVKITLA